MDEALRPAASPACGQALCPWTVAAVLILLAWNGFQAWRMTLPMSFEVAFFFDVCGLKEGASSFLRIWAKWR